MQDHSLHAVTCGSSTLGDAGSAQLQEVLDDTSSHHEELSQGQTIHLGEAKSPVILPVGVDPHLHDGQDPHLPGVIPLHACIPRLTVRVRSYLSDSIFKLKVSCRYRMMILPSNTPCVCTRMSCGVHVYICGCATALMPWRLQMIYFPFLWTQMVTQVQTCGLQPAVQNGKKHTNSR